jgi:hypothetical protein
MGQLAHRFSYTVWLHLIVIADQMVVLRLLIIPMGIYFSFFLLYKVVQSRGLVFISWNLQQSSSVPPLQHTRNWTQTNQIHYLHHQVQYVFQLTRTLLSVNPYYNTLHWVTSLLQFIHSCAIT